MTAQSGVVSRLFPYLIKSCASIGETRMALDDFGTACQLVFMPQAMRRRIGRRRGEEDRRVSLAEDRWHQGQVGDVRLRLCKPGSRRVLTINDACTLDQEREPPATLATFKKSADVILIGHNAVHLDGGVISVGDRVVTCS